MLYLEVVKTMFNSFIARHLFQDIATRFTNLLLEQIIANIFKLGF